MQTPQQITRQVYRATIEAQDCRRLFSDIKTRWVRNGYGLMSQETLSRALTLRNQA